MAGKSFDLTPRDVPTVDTPFRRIVTNIPVPESIPVLDRMHRLEPRSLDCMPPVLWDRAEGVQVYDAYGNMWLDWTSGVLVANVGHSRPEIVDAIVGQARKGLLHHFAFASEIRARLVQKLNEISPDGLDKTFLLTTGAESVECILKFGRTYGQRVGGNKKTGIVSFDGAFHGRTLGAQQAGGTPDLKKWIVNLDPDFHQVPFPGHFGCSDPSFDTFLKALDAKGLDGSRIALVLSETYQGGGADFMPAQYAKALRQWCNDNDVLLAFDEVQACFGRTGKLFAFQNYGVVPDMVCCGKGFSSSLPMSAVIGRADVMDLYGPLETTSTHSGNPVCAAATLANIDVLLRDKLVENSAAMGEILHEGLNDIMRRHADVVGAVHGTGLVAGVHMVEPGTQGLSHDLAFAVIEKCVRKGLLLLPPVGEATVKICPPLCITAEAVREGVEVLDEAITETVKEIS